MIGRLLSTAASTFGREGHPQRSQQPQQAQQLESVTEEAHTRALLYPDPHILRISQHSAIPFHAGQVPATPRDAANYDDRGGLDINFPSDVRVIIAQDANLRYPPQVLFDSKPSRGGASSSIQELGSGSQPARQQNQHSRGKSLSSPQRTATQHAAHQHAATASTQIPTAADLTSPTAFQRPSDTRRSSFFGPGRAAGVSSGDNHAPEAESFQARLAREKEELDALLNCIFGSPGMRLESGTKLHALPKNFPHAERSSSSRQQRPFSPTGMSASSQRMMGHGRNSGVPDAFRSQTPHAAPSQSRNAIMITKLFNVQLPETPIADPEVVPNGLQSQTSSSAATVRPNPTEPPHDGEPRRVKQKKTPMYAVAIIIHLPTDPFPRTRSNPIPGMTPVPTPHQMSVPNSPRSTIVIPSFAGPDSKPSTLPAADPMSSVQISQILGQWPLISRNIRLLEISAQNRLRHMLENIVPLAPMPVPSQGKAGNVKLRRPKLPSQQPVYVAGEALQEDLQIRRQAEDSASNIAFGLRARRVVPGQGRWGAWREEARWVSRWAGTREQNFFFFTFITAFLGQHTSWCEHAAPSPLGRRARKLRRFGDGDTNTLVRKTVIICSNKMAARRLVFLAASFLPGNLKTNPPAFSRGDLSTHVYSESPPPILSTTPKDQQAQPRRTAMRRDSPSVTHADGQPNNHQRSVSFSVAQAPETPTEDDDDRMSFGERLGRRVSEAGSVRSNFTNIPASTREATKASSSTGQADSSVPVAHFSSLSPEAVKDPYSPRRPGSNGSVASAALNLAIRRSESSTTDSAGSLGRFGSMMSGMWSAAPDSTNSLSSNETGLSAGDDAQQRRKLSMKRGQSTSGMRPSLQSPNKLSSMVEEASHLSGSPRANKARAQKNNVGYLGRSPGSQRLDLDFCLKKPSSSAEKTPARSIPRSEPDRMDLSLHMNEEDGFVDVSMLNEKSIESSLASSFASLRIGSFGQSFPFGSGTTTWNSSGDLSEHQSPYGSPSFAGSAAPKPDIPPNVAGWLKKLHPDFALQAVRPYPGLDLDIRQCLESEAKLCLDPEYDGDDDDDGDDEEQTHDFEDQWTDICSILVSDATRYVVEKHTLQRRKRRNNDGESHDRAPSSSRQDREAHRDHTSPPFVLSPSSSVASLPDPDSEKQIVIEPVMDMDPTLIDAIDRVLAQSGPSSRAISRAPSRAPSPTRSRPVSVKSSTVQHSPQSSSATKQDQLRARDQMGSSATATSQDLPEETKTPPNVPFPECRKIIMGALEEVVKTVIEERELAHSGGTSDKRKTVVLTGPGIDGSLREGVARWLSQIDDADDFHQTR